MSRLGFRGRKQSFPARYSLKIISSDNQSTMNATIAPATHEAPLHACQLQYCQAHNIFPLYSVRTMIMTYFPLLLSMWPTHSRTICSYMTRDECSYIFINLLSCMWWTWKYWSPPFRKKNGLFCVHPWTVEVVEPSPDSNQLLLPVRLSHVQRKRYSFDLLI